MAGKIYIVEGRQFKSDAEYKQALKDQETIEKLRERMADADISDLKALSNELTRGKYRFSTLLGDDFADELDEKIKRIEKQSRSVSRKNSEKSSMNGSKNDSEKKEANSFQRANDIPRRRLADDVSDRRRINDEEHGRRRINDEEPGRRHINDEESGRRRINDEEPGRRNIDDDEIEAEARRILKRRELRNRVILILSVGIGLLSIAVFTFFVVTNQFSSNKAFYQLRDKAEKEHSGGRIQNTGSTEVNDEIVIHYTDTNTIAPNVLPEFEEMLNINSKLIGWLTIDGTNIDYPVAQTGDNEYYLTHDLSQNYDRNGTIFLDTNCDVLKPSTNFILYGHHMQSGKMFGKLGKYEDESYYEKHKYITFDTIYEYGTYQVMYVFRSHVYEETEIAFKYYQFIDAYSEVEFDSYMSEMASMSLYDTGVTAKYGDRLLTLSTCDYQETNGRFVVVAKKIN